MNQMNKDNSQRFFRGMVAKIDQFPEQTLTLGFFVSMFFGFVILSMTAFDLRDSDLWFHLNQGRELFATGAIPSTSFFSYIEPVRHWVNYAWLFQAITYQIFIHTGYAGLIVFRSLVYVCIGILLYVILAKNKPYNSIAVALALFSFVGVMPRSILIRPHIFTYLFILLLIAIFEKRKGFLALPGIFLLEANLHGIAYPLLLLIWGGYLLDYYWRYKQKKPIGISNRQFFWVAIAPLFLLLTPHGYHLLPLPFENAASFVHYYIVEMRPPVLSGIFVFELWPAPKLLATVRILLTLLALFLFVYGVCKKILKISHVVLVAGGIYLFLQSIRFQFECLFYMLPVFTAFLACKSFPHKRACLYLNIAAVFIIPLSLFGYYFYNSDHYPVSFQSVPAVSGRFISQLPKGQTALLSPSKAGFFAWNLYPKHTIFMDLELALFDDVSAYEAMHAFTNASVLEHHIRQYHPSVIYVPLTTTPSPEFTAALEKYRPVFFDDFGMVYLRRDVPVAFPELSFVDSIISQQVVKDAFSDSDKEKFIGQLKRVADFDASGFRANVLLGNAYFAFEKPQKMIQIANRLIDNFPDQIAGYVFKAQGLFLLGDYEQSVAYFEQAVSKQGSFDRHILAKNYYVALVQLKRFEEAYAVLKNSYNPFTKETPPDIVYEFAIGAVNAQKYEDAKVFIMLALLALPDQEKEKRKELLRLQGLLQTYSSENAI